MSPILIRPVREQIEHDRIIRVLQARLRKEFAVEANLGDERRVPVRVGEQLFYPDLVLTATGTSKKVQAIIEVETTESVNHLEAMAEWAHYGKSRAPFHLYVPSGLVDIARRLIENYHITVDQLWSYSPVGDQVHFWLVSGDADGSIITSVTDSISAAEPVRPVVPEPAEEPSAEEKSAAAAESAAAGSKTESRGKASRPASPAAPAKGARPAAAPAKPAPKAPPPAPAPAAKAPAAKPVPKAPAPAPAAKAPAVRRAAAPPAPKAPAKAAAPRRAPAPPPAKKAPVKAAAPKRTAAPPAKKAAAGKPAAKAPARKPTRTTAPAKAKRR